MVRDAFIPRTMAAFRPNVVTLADELIDRFVERGSADLMAEFAYVLPISVMCALLAVPVEDREQFIEWDDAISGIQSTGAAEGERALAANDAIVGIEDYFLALARQRRAQPGNDLISLMLTGHHGLEPLGDEELMAMCVGLLLGGHETTRSLIGNLMLHVLTQPDLLDRVRSTPPIGGSVVEEVLRFESPIQRGWRRLTRDVELHGQRLKQATSCTSCSARPIVTSAASTPPPRSWPSVDPTSISLSDTVFTSASARPWPDSRRSSRWNVSPNASNTCVWSAP